MKTIKDTANRIEEVVTNCNQFKMREAIDEIKNTANSALTALSIGNCQSSFLWDIVRKCEATLAEPLRNCDVGTVEQQKARFVEFCGSHSGCKTCPFVKFDYDADCIFAFMHMPYRKEVKK